MLRRSPIFLCAIVIAVLFSCETEMSKPTPDLTAPARTIFIPESPQDRSGNPDSGWHYLRYGNYIGGGIPFNIYNSVLGADQENLLQRTGDNAGISPGFNAFTMNGVKVVGGITCFGCHSGKVAGQFIPGLGDPFANFTADRTPVFGIVNSVVENVYGIGSPEWEAYQPLYRGGTATGSYIVTPFVGVNPAFKLEEVAIAHRNPISMEWVDPSLLAFPNKLVASDIPPMWNVKKKHALYYNGMGRGDFKKLLMQVMVVAVKDSAETRKIYDRFDDVLAWIEQIEPPAYPGSIDQNLAEDGEQVFLFNCAKCHGTYGDNETYPNLFVEIAEVKTDSVYAKYLKDESPLADWINDSWLTSGATYTEAVPLLGYVAPPLDGIWATAPYLHNGSIPTLEDLLKSNQRPDYWSRSGGDMDYDFDRVGWNYVVESNAVDEQVYNTTLAGYGNAGHYYGDALSETDRLALLEYLKTL